MSRILIVGHSHVECLLSASLELGIEYIEVVNIRQLSNKGDSPKVIASNLESKIKNKVPDAVCLCLHGNEHNIISLIEHPIPFSIGGENGASPITNDVNRFFIPHSLMLAHFQHLISILYAELTSLVYERFKNARRFYISPPPPISDWSHIKKHPGVFKNKIHFGPGPNSLKLAAYNIQIEALHNEYSQLGATNIPVEKNLTTEEGFLSQEYYNTDPTHGNKEYGKEMLNAIIRMVEG